MAARLADGIIEPDLREPGRDARPEARRGGSLIAHGVSEDLAHLLLCAPSVLACPPLELRLDIIVKLPNYDLRHCSNDITISRPPSGRLSQRMRVRSRGGPLFQESTSAGDAIASRIAREDRFGVAFGFSAWLPWGDKVRTAVILPDQAVRDTILLVGPWFKDRQPAKVDRVVRLAELDPTRSDRLQ